MQLSQKRNELKLFSVLFFILSYCDIIFASCIDENSKTNIPYLMKLKDETDYNQLLKSDGSTTYVKFTYEFKAIEKNIYFQNTKLYDFHLPFLREQIAKYKGLDNATFENLIFSKERQLIVGSVYYNRCLTHPDNETRGIFGFNIYSKENEFNIEDVKDVFTQLKAVAPQFQKQLVYVFESKKDYLKYKFTLKNEKIESISYEDLAFQSKKETKTYHPSTSYGYLRFLTNEEFKKGDYTAKDILILDQVPLDIGPIAGIITTEPQIPNSHIILRTINQNIPNLYYINAKNDAKLIKNQNQLVQFYLEDNGYWEINDKDDLGEEELEKEAKEYFKSRIPKLPPLKYQLDQKNFYDLDSSKVESSNIRPFYGAKGTNFAIMNSRLINSGYDRSYFKGSFLIPFFYFNQHLENKLNEPLCRKVYETCLKKSLFQCEQVQSQCLNVINNNGTIHSFINETLKHTDSLLGDSGLRRTALFYIQELIEKTTLNSDFLESIRAKLKTNFSDNQRIRFRSSTNAEDLAGLNGAGLYESKSACLGDDKDNLLPSAKSICTTDLEIARKQKLISTLVGQNNSKYDDLIKSLKKDLTQKYPLEKAVKSVFASVWTEKAFLFRDYYQLNHNEVFMGILVHPSFVDEKANGVLTIEEKNENSFQINLVSQINDISITNPEIPFAVPESVAIDVNNDKISQIRYMLRSNLTEQTLNVLSEKNIQDLVLQTLESVKAMKTDFKKVKIFDIEYVISKSDTLLMKQIRPLGVPGENDLENGIAIEVKNVLRMIEKKGSL